MALRGDSEQSREEGEQSAESSCVWRPCRRQRGWAPFTHSLFFTLALSPHCGENDQHESQPDYRRHASSGRPPRPLPVSAAPCTPGSGKCTKGAGRVVSASWTRTVPRTCRTSTATDWPGKARCIHRWAPGPSASQCSREPVIKVDTRSRTRNKWGTRTADC